MAIDARTSSPWMTDFHQQLIRCKQVLLYGNVADRFLLNGQHCSLGSFLRNYFVGERYDIVGEYDVVDGFRFAESGTSGPMQDAFWRLVEASHQIDPSATGGNAPAPAANAPLSTTPPASTTPPRSSPMDVVRARQSSAPATAAETAANPAVRATPPRRRRDLALDQALAAMRQVMQQAQKSAAFVLYFADRIASKTDQLTEDERRQLILLMKAIETAAYLPKGPLFRRKNALILVARQIGSIPEWVYKDNPLLALVQVPAPRVEERQAFVKAYARGFEGGDQIPADQLDRVTREFTNLTEGLTIVDLDALMRTSAAEKLPLSAPKTLIDQYLYGKRDDPWQKLDRDAIQRSHATISQRVIGQPHAVDATVDLLISARVGVSMSEASARGGKPKGVLFFVGPTGVGKTELAKALTQVIFDDETAFARFDMSEFSEAHSAERLTGAPPGFVGYEEGGALTNRVRERPFSLLLFDEIEKGHGKVMDKFLQILEDGRLTDGKGQTAYFSQTMIIFTSNIGSKRLTEELAKSGSLTYQDVARIYRDAVDEHFSQTLGRPEILNRLGDNIVVFDMLRPEFIDAICSKFLRLLADSARKQKGLTLTFPDNRIQSMIRAEMLQAANLAFGGRRIKALMEQLVERPLNRWLFQHQPPSGATLEVVPEGDALSITQR